MSHRLPGGIHNIRLTEERCAYYVNTPFKLIRKRLTIPQKSERREKPQFNQETPNGQRTSLIIRKMQIKATMSYLYVGSLKWVMSSHILISKNYKVLIYLCIGNDVGR